MYLLTGVLGIISAIAPFALGYSNNSAALYTSLGLGVVLVITTVFEWAAEDKQNWEYWVAGIAGIGAIAAPFVLGFSGLAVAVWTLVIVGLVTVLAAGTKLFRSRAAYGY